MSSHQRSKYSSVSLEHPKASLWFPAAAPKAIWPALIGLLVTRQRRGIRSSDAPLCYFAEVRRRSTTTDISRRRVRVGSLTSTVRQLRHRRHVDDFRSRPVIGRKWQQAKAKPAEASQDAETGAAKPSPPDSRAATVVQRGMGMGIQRQKSQLTRQLVM